jgi:hypothetical protein
MHKSFNYLYLGLGLLLLLGALVWKLWVLVVLAVPAIALFFFRRRSR